MDMSLVVINQLSESLKLSESSATVKYHAQWAGANNPLWIIRNNKTLTKFETLSKLEELEEIKPDKMPIAIHELMDEFTNHDFELCNGDCLYLMSDGYEDQFGGPKGKKFMSKRLKELLVTNYELPMQEQKEILEKTLNTWIGNSEQIDDITVMGIRI
jgi:serine phosphatase RsbU (regulator of sigma subunit)